MKKTKTKKDKKPINLLKVGAVCSFVVGAVILSSVFIPQDTLDKLLSMVGISNIQEVNAEGAAAILNFDESASNIESLSTEEIQEMLDKAVDENMFTISIKPEIHIDKNTMEGDANIVSAANNAYHTQCSLYVNDEAVYESGIIEIGKEVKKIQLNRSLEPGTYECKAGFKAIDSSGNPVGATNTAIITLIVE